MFARDNYFLSNFYPVDIEFEGDIYPTSEHAFQAAKCVKTTEKEKIRVAQTPAEAKRIGQTVQLRSDWESQKETIMEDILRFKFQNKHLRNLLNETKGYDLIEGTTWHETYWGICTCKTHRSIGKNVLGKLLMKIRDS